MLAMDALHSKHTNLACSMLPVIQSVGLCVVFLFHAKCVGVPHHAHLSFISVVTYASSPTSDAIPVECWAPGNAVSDACVVFASCVMKTTHASDTALPEAHKSKTSLGFVGSIGRVGAGVQD